MNKLVYGIPLLLTVMVTGITTMITIPIPTFATSEETPCSPPVMMGGSDRFMVERCSDGDHK